MKRISFLSFLMAVTYCVQAQNNLHDALVNAYTNPTAENFYNVGKLLPFNQKRIWLEKAARMGHQDAIYELAFHFRNETTLSKTGLKIPPNYAKAVEMYKKLTGSNKGEALFQLALVYNEGGYGITRNTQTSLYYMELSVQNGYAEACSYLGNSYFLGSDQFNAGSWSYNMKKTRNDQLAFKYLKMGSEMETWGNTECMNMLAYCYATGRGTPKDMNKAHQIIDRAIAKSSQYTLKHYIDSKGEFYLMQGDRVNARKMYDRCIQLDPNWGSQNTALYQGLFR